MISVLFVSHSAELNGAELWLLETLRRLDRKAFAPALVAPRPGPLLDEAEKAGVPVEIVPMKWWVTEKRRVWRQPLARAANIGAVRRIESIARERKADVVFSNSAAMFGGALAAARAGIPHVWSIHEILAGERAFLHYARGSRRLVRFIVDHSARVIVNSEATRAAFPDTDKTVLIYNGLAVRPGDPEIRGIILAEFGLEKGERAIGVIGKMYPGKGQKEVVQAFALLAERYPDLRLVFLGASADARYEQEIRRIVRLSRLDRRVHFGGYRSDLLEVLQTLSVVVVASVVESFGRAALEGMAAGVPVLAVRAGGLAEIIEHGVNGFLAESRRPDVLAEALAGILDHPERRNGIIRNGLRTVREKYSIENQIRGVEAVLRDVTGRSLYVPPLRDEKDEGPLFALVQNREGEEERG